MAGTTRGVLNRPALDLVSSDPEGSLTFYSKLFAWQIEKLSGPGGYWLAKTGQEPVAAIAPTRSRDAATAWAVSVGTDDAGDLAARVTRAGGRILVPETTVPDGRAVVFEDPAGAVISAVQPETPSRRDRGEASAVARAELNSRGLATAIRFYREVFGWTARPIEEAGAPVQAEFQLGDESVAGAVEIGAAAPAAAPSLWLPTFAVDDVPEAYERAIAAGGRGIVRAQGGPFGQFAMVGDPQGAVFALRGFERLAGDPQLGSIPRSAPGIYPIVYCCPSGDDDYFYAASTVAEKPPPCRKHPDLEPVPCPGRRAPGSC